MQLKFGYYAGFVSGTDWFGDAVKAAQANWSVMPVWYKLILFASDAYRQHKRISRLCRFVQSGFVCK